MNSDRWRRIEELYQAAYARPANEREAFLDEVCAGDAKLRLEIESLLKQPVSADGFLERPPNGIAPPAAPMPLNAGTRLGPYEIAVPIGAGGMGEVYRARDTKLGRDVAIKVLPSSFANDPDRLARFRREAQVLASLNHPNIGAIYGLEDADGIGALVLELVEGPTLADRIAQGPIPLREALPIARQMCEALEAAHEHGVIHRDLKPANIKLRPDGAVKVLDFGLAKVFAGDGSALDLSQSPTITAGGTREGMILGTAAYMSPEQARGKAVDKRADVWAFGCVVYEMLTGRAAFAGESVTDLLACIIEREPDFSALSPTTPPAIRRLLRRSLEKDRKRRLSDIADARIEIDETLAAPPVDASAVRLYVPPARWRRATGAIALAVLAGVAGWFLANRTAATTPGAVVRLSIPSLEPPFPHPNGVRHLAISEDGSRVAYSSSSRLWIRRMGQKEAIAVEVALPSNPFFSPNGEWVGFFQSTGLAKVPVLGGTPVPIVMTSERPGGGTWRGDGTIVFATSEGLYQVSENGGEPRLLVKLDPRQDRRRYAWPQFMPDGEAVLFTIVPENPTEGAQIAVLDLKTLETRIVLKGGSAARYASTGHLVYASGQTLKAIAFDPDIQQTRGDPVSIPDIEIATAPDNGAADFAVSETGTLLFITPNVHDPLLRTLSWVDTQGKEEPLALAPGRYQYPRISPDGTRLALDITGANRDIWIWNLQRPSLTRLTGGPTEDMTPLWSLDSRRVFFASDRTGTFDVYSQAADGATVERAEFAGPGFQMPMSFTPDGALLLVQEDRQDVSILTLARPERLEPLVHSQFKEQLAEVSPDGNWIAYESDESGGRTEIFLRPFPNVGAQREKVSIDGGLYPLWGQKGSGELFYVDLNGHMMAASVKLSPSLSLGRVRKLFDWEKTPSGARPYDVSPVDGRFLMTKAAAKGSDGTIDISVVLNWQEELKRLVPTR